MSTKEEIMKILPECSTCKAPLIIHIRTTEILKADFLNRDTDNAKPTFNISIRDLDETPAEVTFEIRCSKCSKRVYGMEASVSYNDVLDQITIPRFNPELPEQYCYYEGQTLPHQHHHSAMHQMPAAADGDGDDYWDGGWGSYGGYRQAPKPELYLSRRPREGDKEECPATS